MVRKTLLATLMIANILLVTGSFDKTNLADGGAPEPNPCAPCSVVVS